MGRPGLHSLALALLLQLHHLREHVADSEQRPRGSLHHEGKLPSAVDDRVHHGVDGRARGARRHARHGVLLQPEETVSLAGGVGADAQHPGAAGDRVGSQNGDLPRDQVHRQRRRQDHHFRLPVRVLSGSSLNEDARWDGLEIAEQSGISLAIQPILFLFSTLLLSCD